MYFGFYMFRVLGNLGFGDFGFLEVLRGFVQFSRGSSQAVAGQVVDLKWVFHRFWRFLRDCRPQSSPRADGLTFWKFQLFSGPRPGVSGAAVFFHYFFSIISKAHLIPLFPAIIFIWSPILIFGFFHLLSLFWYFLLRFIPGVFYIWLDFPVVRYQIPVSQPFQHASRTLWSSEIWFLLPFPTFSSFQEILGDFQVHTLLLLLQRLAVNNHSLRIFTKQTLFRLPGIFQSIH